MGTALQATVMLVLSQPAGAQPAPNARPLGGTLVGGAATISRTPDNTAINQSSQRAAIDWKSFDVGSQQRVTFNQPSSTAATLNRVTGPDPSRIAGRIDANGQVVLLNQSGIMFYKGAQVNTNGLVVSAIGMSKQSVKSFLDTGKLALDLAGNPNARIDNQGTITIRQAGLAALVAPQVANSGVINAKLGHVVLAGAKTATLDLYGDGLLSLDVTNQVTQAPVDKDGTTATALVTNTGVIVADGGTVQLTARAADGIVQNLVRAGGKIRAATMGDQTGSVALNGVGGSVVVEGQLSAPGYAQGTTGGNIEVVSNRNVTIASGARINASGKAGGGVVAIGTTLARAKGGPSVTPTMTAANTFIQSDARIRADATIAGNGGNVTVLATSATTMAGAITAKGGPQGGNGGFVEISGKQLGLSGQVDVSAPKGTIGTILLDPATLEIINGAAGAGDQDENLDPTGTILAFDFDTFKNQVSNGEIDSLTGSIVLQATDKLTVDDNTPITLRRNASLTLQTANGDGPGDIFIGTGSPITASGTGNISVLSNGALTVNSNMATASTGTITLQSVFGIVLNGVSITTGVLDLSNFESGGVAQSAAGGITASTIQSSGGVFGNVSLLGANNAITNIGNFKVVGAAGAAIIPGDFSLNGNSSTDIVGLLSAHDVTINESGGAGVSVTGTIAATGTVSVSAGPITLETAAIVQGTTITLSGSNIGLNGSAALGQTNQTSLLDVTTSAGDFTEASSARISATTLNSTGGVAGNVSLLGTNTVFDLGNIAVTGNLALRDTLPLTVTGIVSAPSGSTFLESSATTGGITIAAGGAVSASASGHASFQASVLDIAPAGTSTAAGTISTGTFELAVDIVGDTMTLGPGGALASLAGITASQLRFGAVTQPGGGMTTTAGGIAVSGPFDIQGLPLELDASGLVTNTAGPLINVGTLTGNAGSVTLTNVSNTIANLGNFTTGGDFALTDAGALTVIGAVAAGAPAAPNAGNTATLTLATGGALQIGVGGGLLGSLNAGNVALTGGGAITEPNGSIATNSLAASTTGTGGDVSLTSTSNQISASTGISATNGSVILVDDPTLVLTGNYSGANLFFEVAAAGDSIALGDATPATLTVPLGGRISLVADNITATPASQITAPSGTLELAPFSAIPVSVAGSSGAGQLLLDATLLSDINTGTSALNTLLIGAFTNIPAGATAAATSASKITIDGVVDLTNSATNLGLFANGPITEPGGPLAVFNVFGTTSAGGGDFALSNTGNAITESTGITATNGNVVVVDGTNLTLIGAHTGNNLFYEIAAATDTLTLGAVRRPATLTTASGGRASLVADNIVGNNGSVIAPSGTVELAPFSAINTSLFGASGLVISPGLVSIIATSTLVAGGFTNVPGGATTSAPSASTVTVDGAVDLTGIASTLEVEATGAITEPGGPLTVANLEGSGGSVQLLNAANKIATLGTLKATTGDLSLADASPVTIDGAVTAFGNVYLTAPGNIAIAATGSIGASPAGRVSLQTDAASIAGPITGGTFEFAPFTGGATVTLGTGGDLASLLGVTVSSARIGAVTLPGGGTPTTTAGAITTVGTFDANNLPVELDATGAIAGAAFPIINVATLSGNAGAVTLDDANNTVANLANFVATGFSLADAINLSVIGAVSGGSSATITDAGTLTITPGGTVTANAVGLTAGNITIAGLVSDGGAGTTSLIANAGTISEPGTLVAGTLSGSATAGASLTGANQIATLGNFTASGLTLSDQTNLSVTGAVNGGASATLLDAGALTIAPGGTVSATAISLTATNITIPGVVTDGGSGTVAMIANAGTISETGSLTAGTLSGSATGAASLTGTNRVAALGSFAASNFVLTDGTDLLIGGTLNAGSIAIRAPANQVSLGDGATIVVGGTVRPSGPIEAALEPANGGPGADIQAASFVQINSSTVTGQAGGPSTLQISVTGNMQFDPPLGLQAIGTWLILNLTNGTAAGNVFVNALDVSYTVPGSTNLFGIINGISGGPAASVASIQPSINVNYLFNGCVIAAATCQLPIPPIPPIIPPVAPAAVPAIVTPPTPTVFTLSNDAVTSALGGLFSFLPGSPTPLIELPNLVLVVAPMLPAPPRQLTDPDVVPPNISYLDY
jgi:filamentous hemagglutinin family protein